VSVFNVSQRTAVVYGHGTVPCLPVAAIMWGSWGQDLPTFWQCGVHMYLDPPLLPPSSGYEQLWSNVVLLLVVLCNYLDHYLVWYNSTSRQLTCPVNFSLAGVKLPFPRHTHLCSNCCWSCRRTTAPCLHACRRSRSPQSQSFGGEHQHSAVMGSSCKK